MRIAQRDMAMLMAMGMWNSQSICACKQLTGGQDQNKIKGLALR